MAENDLLNEFEDFGITIESDVLEKCLGLLRKYGVSPSSLVEDWLAYATTKLGGAAPTIELIANFDRDVLGKGTKQLHAKIELEDSPVIYTSTTIKQLEQDDELLGSYGTPVLPKSNGGAKRNAPEGTPHNKRLAGLGQSYTVNSPSAFSPTTPGTAVKYNSRTNSGEVVAKYPNLQAVVNWEHSKWKPKILLHGIGETALTTQYKYMFNRLRDKYDIIEDRIHSLGKLMADKMQIEEYSPVHPLETESFTTIGRICCDATTGGGKLNASSLLLEGSREVSSGHTVALDVSRVKEYSLFPGQVVAVQGSNPTGKRIAVSSVISPPISPVRKTDVDLPVPMNVLAACGPFTFADDLDFAPLHDLIKQINDMQPHLVILMGPFLDVKNKKIESGNIDHTYQEEFDLFLKKLQASILNTIQVIVIPSWRDVHHRTVFPTPQFQPKDVQDNFHFFSDPCMLNINGVFVGVTSTDILFHLGKEEISCAPQGSDRMARLVSHLFSQQSFYPLCPPAEEMSIDEEYAEEHVKIPFTPHILILPSDLRFFIKNVHDCVVVNTERIVKGVSGGTYAKLQITGQDQNVNVLGEIVRI